MYSPYIIYLFFPSVPGGDSGELLANACNGGTNHPPGYPLFSILAQAAMHFSCPRLYYSEESGLALDWNPTPAWKVNQQCAFFGAMASVLIYMSSLSLFRSYARVGKRIMGKPVTGTGGVIAAVGGITFSMTPLIWEYGAQSAEVFALNNLLCALIVYVTSIIFEAVAKEEAPRYVYKLVYSGALISGLMFANQHASVLFLAVLVPAVLYATYPLAKKENRLSTLLLTSALSFFIGASPYAYLFVTSSHQVRGSWGDLSTLQGLVRHVLRSEYGTFQLGAERPNTEGFLERIILYFSHMSGQTLHTVFPLAIVAVLCGLLPAPGMRELAHGDRRADCGQGSASTGSNAGNSEGNKKKKKVKGKSASELAIPSPVKAAALESGGVNTIDEMLFTTLFGCYSFYLLIWHLVLSNLPLNAPMPFLVHARFWMQPHIVACVFAGTGASVAASVFTGVVRRDNTGAVHHEKQAGLGVTQLRKIVEATVVVASSRFTVKGASLLSTGVTLEQSCRSTAMRSYHLCPHTPCWYLIRISTGIPCVILWSASKSGETM